MFDGRLHMFKNYNRLSEPPSLGSNKNPFAVSTHTYRDKGAMTQIERFICIWFLFPMQVNLRRALDAAHSAAQG